MEKKWEVTAFEAVKDCASRGQKRLVTWQWVIRDEGLAWVTEGYKIVAETNKDLVINVLVCPLLTYCLQACDFYEGRDFVSFAVKFPAPSTIPKLERVLKNIPEMNNIIHLKNTYVLS